MLKPVLAGIVSALVGFAGAFAVVLAGLRGVGADEAQAASGLLAVCLTCGACAVVLGLRTRMPVVVAWSTPGAALLATAGPPPGGFAAAVGAFAVCGLLVVLAGLVPVMSRLVAAIPAPVAGAMLAGVLLPLCLAPVRALVEVPLLAGPVVAVWALLARFARPWAVPAALVVAVGLIVATVPVDLGGPPALVWTAPVVDPVAIATVGVPLFLVTMAGQNVPGLAVLAQFGFRPPLRPVLVTTGLGTLAGAPFGGHAVNLAAISAALAAGPDAGPPERRWIAAVANGVGIAGLGLGAGAATALVLAAPPVLVQAVAGLALLGALVAALTSALAEPEGREAAIVTLLVTAGAGSPVWGLVAGAAMTLLHRPLRASAR
jgi:benzoate membrane transport protein